MTDDKAVLQSVDQKSANDPEYIFWCPGCETGHWFKTTGDPPRWTWNGDVINPSVRASILVETEKRCHLFVTGGNLQFLSDCSHKFAGQTIPMEPWP